MPKYAKHNFNNISLWSQRQKLRRETKEEESKGSLTFLFDTSDKRIPGKANRTAADRIVVDNLAASIEAASAWARISTSLIQTGLILCTIGTHNTLWPTWWRCANIVSLTRTHRMPTDLTAHTKWPTWRRLTWVPWRWWSYRKIYKAGRRINKYNTLVKGNPHQNQS